MLELILFELFLLFMSQWVLHAGAGGHSYPRTPVQVRWHRSWYAFTAVARNVHFPSGIVLPWLELCQKRLHSSSGEFSGIVTFHQKVCQTWLWLKRTPNDMLRSRKKNMKECHSNPVTWSVCFAEKNAKKWNNNCLLLCHHTYRCVPLVVPDYR